MKTLLKLATATQAPRATMLVRFMVGAVFFEEGIQKFLFPDLLVLLYYVESTKTSSNFRPQQWQKPMHRSNHGRILLSVCSHVTPEVFFGAQVDDCDKQIRQDGQDQVVMKPALAAPLEMIQTQIGLSPLEILFDVPA